MLVLQSNWRGVVNYGMNVSENILFLFICAISEIY